MNTQPWHLWVVTGDALDRIRKGNTENMLAGVPPTRDIDAHGAYEGVHRQRQIDVAVQLFEAMGIARDDKDMRQDWVMRGFRQFDAPVSIVLTFDKVLEGGAVAHFDMGAICFGIVLGAWERGLGCVINSQGIMQSQVVREVTGIPEDQNIMTCIAMGYPNFDFAANEVKSKRRPNNDIVTFIGFGDD
jgi:nitroreductase